MRNDELLPLLARARAVLDRHLFEESGAVRDDVAEICMAIDDALPAVQRSEVKAELEVPVVQRSVAA
jgi:hypothetical protein